MDEIEVDEMGGNRMRRILSILTVAALAAAFAASAANLGVDGGVIQAGDDYDLTCDSDGVDVLGWGLETDTTPEGEVSNVRIGDISDDCQGADLFVNITSAGNTVADGSFRGLSASETGADDVTVQFGDTLDPEEITDIHIFIEGGNQTP